MTKIAKSYTSQRRNFRLSPLEMLIVALIVLGVLYLITLWVGSLVSTSSSTIVSAPGTASAELRQMAIETDKLTMRVAKLEHSLKGLPGQSGVAPGVARLQKRLDRVERMVSGLAKGKKVVPVVSPALEGRISALEKGRNRGGPDPKLQKRLASLEARMSKLALAPDQMATKNEVIQVRLRRLEAAVRQGASSQAPPPAGVSPRLEKRLQNLERKLAEAADRMRAPAPRPAPVQKAKPAPVLRAAPQPKPSKRNTIAKAKRKKLKKIVHRVRPGQTLYGLARKYKVKSGDILKWNPVISEHRRQQLWIGQKVVIYR